MTPAKVEPIEVAEARSWKPSLKEGARAGLVRVSPNGKSLAYARFDEEGAGLYVEDEAGAAVRIVQAMDFVTEEIAWSPDGSMLAYIEKESDEVASARRVGWAMSSAPGELGSVSADAFAWRPDSKAIFLYGGYSKWLAVQDIGGSCIPIGGAADTRDARDPKFPIRMAVGPEGARVAVSVRSTIDLSHAVFVWSKGGKEEGAYETALLTDVPGVNAFVCPFWSPKGRTLGLMIAHRERRRSGIVAFRGATGEGEILYESDAVDPAGPPAWAPSGSRIAFVRAVSPARRGDEEKESFELVLLDCESRALSVLLRLREMVGSPRFLRSNILVLDGGSEAQLIRLTGVP